MKPVTDVVEELKGLDQEYFKLFMEYFPSCLTKEKEGIFGPTDLFERAIKAQTLLTMLGETATRRMNYIGFGLMYPFDNPVDWFNWKEEVKKRNIPISVYFSISIRMTSEFNRMRLYLEGEAWEQYTSLSESAFLVSKDRYSELFSTEESAQPLDERTSGIAGPPARPNEQRTLHIENFHYNQEVEEKAVDHLDRIQKHSSIWSNVVNVAAKLLGS